MALTRVLDTCVQILGRARERIALISTKGLDNRLCLKGSLATWRYASALQ